MARDITRDSYAIGNYAMECGAKLVDVSTSEVYGPVVGALPEDQPKLIPARATIRLEYAVGKLAAEVMLLNMASSAGLNVSIVRPFNVSGPRQSPAGGFVIPRFVCQALNGIPLTVFGTGQQIRAFTHVEDIVGGLIAAMDRGEAGQVYNIGNLANKTTVSNLADLVIEYCPLGGEKVFVDPKSIHGPLFAEAADKYPDATKAMRELDWKPQHSLISVVHEVFRYYKEARPQAVVQFAEEYCETDKVCSNVQV